MRLTTLPPLSRQERLTLAFCAALAIAAAWLTCGSIARVADGTPPEPTLVPATAGPPVIFEGEP